MAFSVAGLALLAFLSEETSVAFIVVALMVLGIGFGLFSSPNTNAIMGSVDRRSYGVASAMVGTMRLTGQLLSMGIATMIFSIYVGHAQVTATNHGSFLAGQRSAFVVFAIACFAGVFVSLARGSMHTRET
jgi:hypothetical protein